MNASERKSLATATANPAGSSPGFRCARKSADAPAAGLEQLELDCLGGLAEVQEPRPDGGGAAIRPAGVCQAVKDYQAAYPLAADASPAECNVWANNHPAANTRTRREILARFAFLMTIDRAELGGVYESHQATAYQCQCSKRGVRKVLAYFAEVGVLTVEHRKTPEGRDRANLYKLVAFSRNLKVSTGRGNKTKGMGEQKGGYGGTRSPIRSRSTRFIKDACVERTVDKGGSARPRDASAPAPKAPTWDKTPAERAECRGKLDELKKLLLICTEN